ncbi:MAG: hypothetical protein AAF098_19175, partial [Pseudomonadota bacterium]
LPAASSAAPDKLSKSVCDACALSADVLSGLIAQLTKQRLFHVPEEDQTQPSLAQRLLSSTVQRSLDLTS